MKNFIILIIVMQLVAITLYSQSLHEKYGYPREAHLVPLSNAANLQSELDTYKRIRLEPGNYNTDVTLKSGYAIYGLQSYGNLSQIGTCYVEGGTSNAVVYGLKMDCLYFPQSDNITHDNYFWGNTASFYKIKVDGGTLEDNQFFNYYDLRIDNTEHGYCRNNHFVRGVQHGIGEIKILGNDDLSSYGNSIFMFNYLTPNLSYGKTDCFFKVRDQKSFNGIRLNSEGANTEMKWSDYHFFDIKGGQYLNWIYNTGPFSDYTGLNTSMGIYDLDFGKITMYLNQVWNQIGYDNERDEVVIIGKNTKYISSIVRRSDKGTFMSDPPQWITKNSDIESAEIYSATPGVVEGAYDFTYGGLTNPSADDLTVDQQTTLDTLLSMPYGTPWERYENDTEIPDRLPDSEVIIDSTAYIQNLVDTEGLAFLDAGIYYVSSPIFIGLRDAVVGAGKGKTIIRAMSDTVDIFRSNPDTLYPRLTLMDLSLENGRNGLRYKRSNDAVGSSKSNFYQATYNVISHVEFYNMSNAGIMYDWEDDIDGASGIDNNMTDYCDFINCTYGLKADARNSSSYMKYMDKCTYYRCRYIGCNTAVYSIGNRACNGNVWNECLFKDNLNTDIYLNTHADPTVLNSVFESPYASTIWYSRSGYEACMFNCTINSGNPSATLFPLRFYADGLNVTGSGAKFFLNEYPLYQYTRFVITNSKFHGTFTDNIKHGMFYNCMSDDPGIFGTNKLVTYNWNDRRIVLSSENGYVSEPSPRVLVDHMFDPVTSVKEGQFTASFELKQNYPNPFNPITTIEYSIPAVGTGRDLSVQLKIYNILGQEVTTLVNQQQAAGKYTVKFDASSFASGVYLYIIRAGEYQKVRKMLLLK